MKYIYIYYKKNNKRKNLKNETRNKNLKINKIKMIEQRK